MSSSWKTTHSYGGNDGDDDNDDNDELEEEESKERLEQQRDCLVYLIDASPPMHVEDADGVSPFKACLNAASAQFRSRIINDHHDKVAIVLYGCASDLDEPSAGRIAQLERLAERRCFLCFKWDGLLSLAIGASSSDPEVGSGASFVLHEAFWVVNTIFSKSARKNDHKRVFLMTNCDRPHESSVELKRLAITRAKDLSANGVVIYLFGLENKGLPFEFDAFYKDNIVFSSDWEEGDEGSASQEEQRYFNASGGLEALTKNVEQKVFKKRTAFRCAMILGEGLEFGIRGYNLVSEVKPSSFTYLVGATNEEAAVQTSYVCKTTSQQLGMSDMDSYYPFGGEKAVFTKEEVAAIKHFGDPGVRLIGFKPLAAILRKPYHNLKHSVFVVPDETAYAGSSSIFIQLLARMHARAKGAICSYIPRKGVSPRVVALLPQMEEYDAVGNVIRPSGFHLIHIPFNDDLRKIDNVPEFDISEKLPVLEPAVKVFSEIIDKTTIKNFSIFNYQNPALQKHYANLQAVALKRDAADEVEDATEPNTAAIMRRIAKYVPKLREVLPEPEEPAAPVKTASKRKPAVTADAAPAAKKPKAGVGDDGRVDEDAVKGAWKAGTLQKLTVPILTAFLKQNGVLPEKRKDGLVAQVEAHFSSD
ncbi:X-ray repair cross-complementing protein 6 [Entophlyctis luteolus]|nr:X-ray repair cross-complementing protein 6 [Entophlyctis luteolus]